MKKISSKLIPKVFDKAGDYVYLAAGVVLPPILDKLLFFLNGADADSTHKFDAINGYHFLITTAESAPGAWDGEYLAPALGEPGHDELKAADDGTLYTGDTANILTRAILDTWLGRQYFFCPGRGIYGYVEALVNDELLIAQQWCGVTYWEAFMDTYWDDEMAALWDTTMDTEI